jgi:hypothetical protein
VDFNNNNKSKNPIETITMMVDKIKIRDNFKGKIKIKEDKKNNRMKKIIKKNKIMNLK